MRKINYKPGNIQTTIMIAFSIISALIILSMGIMMYWRFSDISEENIIENNQKLMEQTAESVENYLINMRQISDAAYYYVIKENDLSGNIDEIHKGMNLLYEANKDKLRSIAVYNKYGSLMAAEPVATQKEEPDVTKQEWFIQAMNRMENIHFSTPHVQNLFDDGTYRYYWVISASRVVELTNGTESQTGVLLVDMDYSGISRMMEQINASGNGQYYYLCDGNGNIIYHPHQVQLDNGMQSESSVKAAASDEKIYDEYMEGVHRKVIVNSISYTGWKLVGVMPYSIFTTRMADIKQFVLVVSLLMAMMLELINQVVSVRISSPIMKLNNSVNKYEEGKEPHIYIGGSEEIRHLGKSIQESYKQNLSLMKRVVWEQNERRKSELDVLQSQINPHFLYNTLDSITWMIEGEKNEEAAFMITQLAKLFRISLSKGHTIISIRDELQHAQSYMNIQKIRYKNKFEVVFDIDPEILDHCVVKLVLQPILENAINYGIREMDGCGIINVCGKKADDRIILSVSDNGMGIPDDEIGFLLKDTNRIRKRGSGVGLVNVNNRIKILFGGQYGLYIESELDEGTTVYINIPAIEYTEENRKHFEERSMPEEAQ
ncbi:MAG: sensor histidine kinase [Agathobacter sp.]|uniref:cache domain-containing sensor histidine kinase n=1 Tax=Agathobacter sp. TaxID=2021311 RepID=UPI003991A838